MTTEQSPTAEGHSDRDGAPTFDVNIDGRVTRLLWWYPVTWQQRYGEEFAQLLRDTLSEEPRGLRTTINVAREGLSTRLQLSGILGDSAPARTRARSGLLTMLTLAATFFVVAHVLSHYASGQRLGDVFQVGGGVSAVPHQIWATLRHPNRPLLTSPGNYFALTAIALCVSVIAAAIPVAIAWCRSLGSSHRGPIVRPVVLFAASAVAYEVGRLMRFFGHSFSIRGQTNARFPILGSQSLGVRIGLLGLETGRVFADAAAVIAAVAALLLMIRSLELGPRTVRFEVAAFASIAASLIGLAGVNLWTALWGLPFAPSSFFLAHNGAVGTPMWVTFGLCALVMAMCAFGAIASSVRLVRATRRI
jgi:hypothetical protein